jgi:hypothetical protein
MNKSLLLGAWKFLIRIPRHLRQGTVAKSAKANQAHVHTLSPDHQRVRDCVVLELPRTGAPLSAAYIAQKTGLSVDRVQGILADLERGMTFLFRNAQGEVV